MLYAAHAFMQLMDFLILLFDIVGIYFYLTQLIFQLRILRKKLVVLFQKFFVLFFLRASFTDHLSIPLISFLLASSAKLLPIGTSVSSVRIHLSELIIFTAS